ncbi:hypothetical protein CCACVL1_28821 [Corchorus capsularis]|uniref:Uncharacterized protein n=1 Tax=Corchorus capsularis TaxID=210143 RepID=A0A1R3G519_COCAP|nr:hypothetical protein CCACVL1_28821 [Corchorus capsularis]
MGETSKGRARPPPPPSGKTTRRRETRPQLTSPPFSHLQTLNPIARLSPRNNGSTLYDSYELRAVTYQLNKAMQRSSGSSPAYLCYLKSPFYSEKLVRANRENTRAPKRVLCSHLTCATISRNESNNRAKEVTRGFAAKLWNKLKLGLLRSITQRNNE